MKTETKNALNIVKHSHQQGEKSAPKKVVHGNKVDYVHDGRGHRIRGNRVDPLDGQGMIDPVFESRPKENQFSNSTLDSLERVSDRAIKENLGIIADDEIADMENILNKNDPNFRSELKYDGYDSIVEYDNNSYGSLDSEKEMNSEAEVKISDRENVDNSDEESLVDPQGNRA